MQRVVGIGRGFGEGVGAWLVVPPFAGLSCVAH